MIRFFSTFFMTFTLILNASEPEEVVINSIHITPKIEKYGVQLTLILPYHNLIEFKDLEPLGDADFLHRVDLKYPIKLSKTESYIIYDQPVLIGTPLLSCKYVESSEPLFKGSVRFFDGLSGGPVEYPLSGNLKNFMANVKQELKLQLVENEPFGYRLEPET